MPGRVAIDVPVGMPGMLAKTSTLIDFDPRLSVPFQGDVGRGRRVDGEPS